MYGPGVVCYSLQLKSILCTMKKPYEYVVILQPNITVMVLSYVRNLTVRLAIQGSSFENDPFFPCAVNCGNERNKAPINSLVGLVQPCAE